MKKISPGTMGGDPASPARQSSPTLDRKVQARIGDQLRALHHDLVSQPIPQHLVDVLRRLEEASQQEAASAEMSANPPGLRSSESSEAT